MSKFLPVTMFLTVLSAGLKAVHLMDLTGARYSSTPGIPHSKGRNRIRTHAPNDGHWHMKFHRGRV